MTSSKTFLIPLTLGAGLLLGACADSSLTDPNNPNRQRDQGALIGAGIGAVLGQITGGDTQATIAGAAVGGIAGGLIGAQLDRQEADLRRDLGNDRVTITNTGDRLIVSLPQDILFATDSFAVRSDLQRDLRAIAGNLQAYPNSTVQVLGHTDNTGDAAYNQTLSERRAHAVADILLDSGIPASRIQAIGRGETQPIATNLDAAGKARNRRVEIVILPSA